MVYIYLQALQEDDFAWNKCGGVQLGIPEIK